MKLSDIPWVIAQAGGKGNRLQHFTWNKPKCLLSVAGQPLLNHLFDRFPSANFIIIGDYHYDVLEQYLQVFPPDVSVQLIQAETKGTISGIDRALTYLPEDTSFLLTWCDLLFEQIPDCDIDGKNWIGLSRSFKCRWSYNQARTCVEEASTERGIAGFFVFDNKTALSNIPHEGECVRWLSKQPLQFEELFLDDVYELGTLDSVAEYQQNSLVSRFFNTVEVVEDRVVKQARVPEFKHLIETEINWYRTVHSFGFDRIPALISDNPMTISRIPGVHPFEMTGDLKQREKVLLDIFQLLDRLHSCDKKPADSQTVEQVYLQKTCDRVHSVAQLIPDFDRSEIQVNGCLCRNPFHSQHQNWLSELVSEIQVEKFVLIHGDPTFSNMLVDDNNQAWLIDPRGYFGSSLLYGDAMYDWAKLYYSVVGDYDPFNRRRFKLKITGKQIDLDIESNGWQDLEPIFAERFSDQMSTLRLLHALIWLSLSGYVKDDYDSILASFYNGIFWLEKAVA